MDTIKRASLGRVSQIGALYDVRTESCLIDTIFSSKLENDDIDTMELGDTSVELVTSDSLEEKFHKLDIQAELQISVLAGLVSLSGSGSYLNDQKKSARAARMSLIYRVRTASEEVYIRQHRKKIDTELLKQSLRATHVVVGIEWGAVCSITCEYENRNNEEVTRIEGALSAEINKLKGVLDAKGSAKVEYGDTEKTSGQNFSFTSKCDISSSNNDLPVTFEEVVQQAKSLPSLVKETNEGKGVPLMFALVPLETIIKMCSLQIESNILFQTVREDIIKQCVQAVKALSRTSQRLHDLRSDMKRNEDILSDNDLNEINRFVDAFTIAELKFKVDLQDLLKDVRSNNKDTSSLGHFLEGFLEDRFSPSNIDEKLRKFQPCLKKISEVESMKKIGITYIGKQGEVNLQSKEIIFVFNVADVKTEEERTLLNKSKLFFMKLHETHKNDEKVQFYIVDLSIRYDSGKNIQIRIERFKNGTMASKDLMEDEGLDADKSLIEMVHVQYCNAHPNDRALVKLKCPNSITGNSKCSGDSLKWACKKCKADVSYGIQSKLFYCKCGSSNPTNALFRCNEINHGIEFMRYQKDILIEELSQLRAIKEINILILGETGVGKSTWINGFANYLYFENLNEAISNDNFITIIPSKFTFTNGEGETQDIIVGGENANENFATGHSATQEPIAYPFYIGDQLIHLIDTPGIGDSRGIEEDKKNFDNILAHLSYYEEIHGICILLKPNNARLTVMFRFCIQELLSHLHRDAVRNITFCFTNTRGSFYRPGDTLPPLRKELRDNNVGTNATPHNTFCFDNEAFRFLACVRNKIKFNEKETEAFSASWDVSVKETQRLFKHIMTLKPHKLLDTLSINDARKIIVELSRPMAEITVTIQKNIHDAEESIKKINLVDGEISDFRNKLEFTGTDLEHKQLDYPRTVCTHSSCIEYVASGKDQLQQTNYKQHCHTECYVSGIPTETIGDSRLQHCWAMTNNECRICHHSYSVHMHRTYDLIAVKKTFICDSVQNQINQKKDKKAEMQAFKDKLDILVKELKTEEKCVLEISAKFGQFLKDFAIIPYNDAMGDYLDMIIEQENRKDSAIKDSKLLERLMNSKKSYAEVKRSLETAMGGTTDRKISSPEEVEILKMELFRLKHFGKRLKDIFDKIEQSKKMTFHYRQGFVPTPPQSTKSRRNSTLTSDNKKWKWRFWR